MSLTDPAQDRSAQLLFLVLLLGAFTHTDQIILQHPVVCFATIRTWEDWMHGMWCYRYDEAPAWQ